MSETVHHWLSLKIVLNCICTDLRTMMIVNMCNLLCPFELGRRGVINVMLLLLLLFNNRNIFQVPAAEPSVTVMTAESES
jgi:hypothetical protein